MSDNMPKALIELSEHSDRIVNVVKARDGLRTKSEAIESIIEAYEEFILDPPFRPEFVEEIKRIEKGPFIEIEDLDELL